MAAMLGRVVVDRKSKHASNGSRSDASFSGTKMALIPFTSTVIGIIGSGHTKHDKWQKYKGDPTDEPHSRSYRTERLVSLCMTRTRCIDIHKAHRTLPSPV